MTSLCRDCCSTWFSFPRGWLPETDSVWHPQWDGRWGHSVVTGLWLSPRCALPLQTPPPANRERGVAQAHSVAAVVTVHSSGMTFQFCLSVRSAECCKIPGSDLNPLCVLLHGHPLPPPLEFVFGSRLHADAAWPHEIRGNTYRMDYDQVWQIPSEVIRDALNTSVSEICVSNPCTEKYVGLVAVKPGRWRDFNWGRRQKEVNKDDSLTESQGV